MLNSRIIITLVGLYDDNFGEMLIRINTKQLVLVILKNLGVDEHSYRIEQIDIINPDVNIVQKSNIILFVGGGLFAGGYLGFIDYIEKIVSIAEKKNIPVLFSAMGINVFNDY